MKSQFQRCSKCGLAYDRATDVNFCPHCRSLTALYVTLGLAVLTVIGSITALICNL